MKCEDEDDHKNWPGGSAAADAVSITVPPYQVDQSSGYRPHQMTLPSLPAPTPAQVNTVGATAILVIIGRVLLVGAVVVP